ncbi:MAG: branched-chain amino acid ABC transporter permease [Methylobacteriaceae bacterium]|nr:branched-chain amino acid ABC transporter permease [Methylobacteriaceae bacterium]
MIETIVQVAADAVSLGGLYALSALGIGLIFGVMRLINFAHGDLITAAGYAVLLFASQSVAFAIVGALVAAILAALAIERAAFRPLRGADPATLLIASFAVSVFLQKTLILFVGGRPKGVNFLPVLEQQVAILGIHVQLLQIVTILVTAAILIALSWFLKRTRYGLEMRAAAENFRVARLLGVRADRVIAMAFAISGALAAIVSLLFTAETGLVQPRMGLQLVIVAFVSTVIGGLGNLAGAALGGFLVGVTTILLQSLLPEDLRAFREAFVFIVVIAVLLLRPQGLLPARGLRERV